MNQKHKLLTIGLLVLLLSSCLSHEILIKEDGSAHVKTLIGGSDRFLSENKISEVKEFDDDSIRIFLDSISKGFNSKLISNYSSNIDVKNRGVIEYDISNIDSLIKYLNLGKENGIQVDYKDNILEFSNIKNDFYDVIISGERKIKKVEPQLKYIEKLNSHSVRIYFNPYDLPYIEEQRNNFIDTIPEKITVYFK